MPEFLDINALKRDYYQKHDVAKSLPEVKVDQVQENSTDAEVISLIKELLKPLLEYSNGNEVMVTNYSDNAPKDSPSYCVQIFSDKIIYQLRQDGLLKRIEYDVEKGTVSDGNRSLDHKPNIKINLFRRLVRISEDIKDEKAMVYIAENK